MGNGVAVDLKSVRRVFDGGITAIDDLSLTISPGEFVSILGPSGCGKSTLLRIIAGLDRATAGQITLSPQAKIAYVFQDAHLLPWRSVLKNVALPLELLGASKAHRLAAAKTALSQVGLADAMDRYPNQLSGGMRMRVSLARALVNEPNLLLLDEPFAALDEITRQKLDEQLRHLWQQRGLTILFVTHSTAEAIFLANRTIVLSPRPATLVLDKPVDLPANRDGPLRATPQFAEQTRFVVEALERGDA